MLLFSWKSARSLIKSAALETGGNRKIRPTTYRLPHSYHILFRSQEKRTLLLKAEKKRRTIMADEAKPNTPPPAAAAPAAPEPATPVPDAPAKATPKPAAPAPAAPAKDAAAPEATAPAGDKPSRGRKIRRMSLAQVEKALAHARSTMGGEASHYVKHLLAHQAELEAKKAGTGPSA
jgi:hypothetical protein